jgi:transposase
MAKTFREWDVDQAWLLPPSVHDFVPPGHSAHLIRDLVRETLDLGAIFDAYPEDRGQPPYHPAMMTALLLYAYSRGIYASRRIALACAERVDFMAVTGMQRPDFRTISDFRKRHLQALGALFVQVLGLCRAAGLVKLGHVALDGTRIKANASKHKAMSYGRMVQAEAALAEEVAAWLAAAEAADAADDAALGVDRRGDEMPAWVADKAKRLAKIRAAKAALEAAAQAAAEARASAAAAETAAAADGGDDTAKDGAAPPVTPPPAIPPNETPEAKAPATPKAKAQRNFTDPDSRIMKTKDGFIQGYNAQAAVDGGDQIIVAHGLTDSGSDQAQLTPLVDAIRANTGHAPKEISADAGYASEVNLETLATQGIRAYIATGRQRHGQPAATGRGRQQGPRLRAMRTRLRRGGFRSRYRLRKQIVEPVFGQIKQARGFRQFLLRGLDQVRLEWALVCTAHNLVKLTRALA